MPTVRLSPGRITTGLLILGLVVTAVLTPIHGEAGTAEEISERDAWWLIHVLQIFSYLTIAVGALAYGMAPGRADVIRSAMALLAIGALLVAMGHVVDGPVRVEMIEQGLGDGDPLYDLSILSATWLIVPGYALLGLGGVLHAGHALLGTKGASRVVAAVAALLLAVGSLAGASELVEGLPGILFLALVLGWLWQAGYLGSEVWATTRRANALPS